MKLATRSTRTHTCTLLFLPVLQFFISTILIHTCKGFLITNQHTKNRVVSCFHPTTTKSTVVTSTSTSASASMGSTATPMEKKVFGTIEDQPVYEFTITNKNGIKARVMEYGAILISLHVPDASGSIVSDITHGFDTLEEWRMLNSPYFGSTIGRFGNRIANGCFSIGESSYQLAINNEPSGIPNSIHGGIKGFNNVLWKGSIINDQAVEFHYISKDGEEGYPGNLDVKVIYTLTDDNELKWEVSATTDAPTVVNIVNHNYWNLSGNPTTTILDHVLKLNASQYLPTTEGLIPTGERASVDGTPMDFTTPQVVGKRIDEDFEALNLGAGYDHCFVLPENSGEVQLAARIEDPKSGRVMEVFTDQPGVQFYTSNFLDGTVIGKGIKYDKRSAFCLETQLFPDSPNQPEFPSSLLVPGETYKHTLIHKFSTH